MAFESQSLRPYSAPPLNKPTTHKVLLVHDKDTDKAAAAIDVGVGSLFDGDVEGGWVGE